MEFIAHVSAVCTVICAGGIAAAMFIDLIRTCKKLDEEEEITHRTGEDL